MVESAIEKARALEDGRRVERKPVNAYAGAVSLVVLATLALFWFEAGLSAARPLRARAGVAQRRRKPPFLTRSVKPGNVSVPKGADQAITAELLGFAADQPVLMVRKSADGPFERVPLIREDTKFQGMLFDLAGSLDYFEAGGVRSTTFRLNVWTCRTSRSWSSIPLPGQGRPGAQKDRRRRGHRGSSWDRGRVKIVPTMPTKGGQIVERAAAGRADPGADGTLAGKFVADKDGFYRVELDAPTGERVTASPQYTIDVLTDQPPTVSIAKPGRDSSASPIEEVFIEARAEDDFGIRISSWSTRSTARREVRAAVRRGQTAARGERRAHVLPRGAGRLARRFVSYYARARQRRVQGGKKATSDIYFVQVRPLKKDFRRAESQAGGGGGGGGEDNQVGALSQQQRQIISATFNINRDRKTMTAEKLKESSVVALSQSKLREQVEGLLTRMNSRLVEQDPRSRRSRNCCRRRSPRCRRPRASFAPRSAGALEPEQKALQILQKAEEEYEVQISMQRGGGGGGGGGQSATAQELADLFEMELDKVANQYETAQRAEQNTDQKVDELMEKLRELARRQEQEAERQRQRALAGQQGGSGSNNNQRALAEQVEEAARRLEQLSREENRSDLAQTAKQLRDAADAMRRASANGDPSAARRRRPRSSVSRKRSAACSRARAAAPSVMSGMRASRPRRSHASSVTSPRLRRGSTAWGHSGRSASSS